jgi:hypothetical protein
MLALAMSPEAPPSRQSELRAAMRLALVPIGVALTLGLLLLPRRGEADSVPVPIPDRVALARAEAVDHDLAERTRREPLAGNVRALGSAIREFHRLEVGGDLNRLGEARRAVDVALVDALSTGEDAMLRLRAVQVEQFVVEVRAFESSGVESPELIALAGAFVRSMKSEGWCEGHELAARAPALRAMFKQMWNGFLGLDGPTGRRAFALSLDEVRALYAFYLSHPHPATGARAAIDAARRGAHDARACETVDEAEVAAVEAWRLERIGRLASLDPDYPAAYAAGVANLRRHKYAPAADALRTWIEGHPEGPLSLRARSFLRTALEEERVQ